MTTSTNRDVSRIKLYTIEFAAAINGVDPHHLHTEVEDAAMSLIESFSENGKADLLYDYSFPPLFAVLNRLMGRPDDLAEDIAEGMTLRLNAFGEESVRGASQAKYAFQQFAAAKRHHLGNDIVSKIILHPHNLNDRELVGAFMSCYGAGIQPMVTRAMSPGTRSGRAFAQLGAVLR